MAKEFKDYNKKYREYEGKLFAYEGEIKTFEVQKWFRGKDTVVYSNEEVRVAVYLSESAEEWQKFRVSLKKFSTSAKLTRLEYRWHYMHNLYARNKIDEYELHLEEIRIDNYIGALRRANMLNSNFEVIK